MFLWKNPLSLTVDEGEELVQLAEQNRLTLMVGHILQYHQAVIKLKELVDEGELGRIQSPTTTRVRKIENCNHENGKERKHENQNSSSRPSPPLADASLDLARFYLYWTFTGFPFDFAQGDEPVEPQISPA